MSTTFLILASDVVAITVLAFGIYFVRYRRREMLVAYMSLNVGVMAVAMVLANTSVAAGLGLGLFGVLSIIRLRSSALTQEEVGYYFASLALGLIAGLQPEPWWVTPLVATLIVLVMFGADHPRLFARNRQQVITLDSAITDEVALVDRLESLLGADVQHVIVERTDLVLDVTVVDVRYRLDGSRVSRAPVEPSSAHDRVPGGKDALVVPSGAAIR